MFECATLLSNSDSGVRSASFGWKNPYVREGPIGSVGNIYQIPVPCEKHRQQNCFITEQNIRIIVHFSIQFILTEIVLEQEILNQTIL